MDNRRVFRSYRDKVKDAASPYARPSNGLFSKMKLFLTGASLWSSNANTAGNIEHNNTTAMEFDQNESSSKPFSFPEPDTTIFKTPMKSTTGAKAPNQVLSSFFQEKGDKPLTDVEYEGVFSLLAKSKSAVNTPNNSVVYRGDTSKQIESGADSTEIGHKEADTSAFKFSGSKLFVTPYSQKTLKNINSNDDVLSTPEYKPVYHAINENSNSKNVPSVKRVYQFSGLPSPYRTRIRAPSLSSKQKIATKNTSSISKSPSAPPNESSRPISNAANSLLKILDDNTTLEHEDDTENTSKNKIDNIQQFSNPYHRPLSTKKPRSQSSNKSQSSINSSTPLKKKKGNLLSADDINRTISYDKSEELPQDKTGSKVKGDTINKSKPSSIQKPDNGKLEFESQANTFKGTVSEKPKVEVSTTNDEKSNKAAGGPSPNELPLKPNGFSFGKTTKPSMDTKPVSHNINKTFEFEFPDIIQTEVQLNYSKVEKYKPLFQFQ